MEIHKHYEIAHRAHQGTSFVPDKRAEQTIKDYQQYIQQLNDAGCTDDQINKFDQLFTTWLNSKSNVMSPMITGPANFPADRNRKRMEWEHNHLCKMLDYVEKVTTPKTESTAIKSSDDDAITKLEKKLEQLERNQELMKSVNKIVRSKKSHAEKAQALDDLNLNEQLSKDLIQDLKQFGKFEGFQLSNNNANIKATRERLESLKNKKEQESTTTEYNGFSVEHNYDDMRYRIYFDGKPDQEVRQLLKSNGFKWAPSQGAWQRQITYNAQVALDSVIDQLTKGELKCKN